MRTSGKFQSSKQLKKKENLKHFKSKNENKWMEGRRVVELAVLTDGLRKCSSCESKLHLTDIIRETRYGLGSILYVTCVNCQNINSVPTGKRHGINGGSENCFDINTKLAAAMLNAGIGEQQVNNILAELNIPTVTQKTLKKREREIGLTFEKSAEMSCEEAIKKENECIINISDCESTSTSPLAEVSTDGAWQRRGTGLSRNSLSGHVTVIGKLSKKCLSYSVAKKRCKLCEYASKRGKIARMHSCRKNWSGSAKGMEPFLTQKSLRNLRDKGMYVKKLIMDDDTTTFLRAKKSLGYDLEKASDRNHVIKNITNDLFKLKEKHHISIKVISHLKKCITYAISQNETNPEGLRASLTAVVPHTFGNHARCQDSWCRYLQEGDGYKHSTLPYGKDLVGENLRKDLNDLFDKFTTETALKKLTDLSCSNPNENLNSMISRKAPKSQHYSDSDSLDFRVAATVNQKNDGHSYIIKVNERHGLSPGKFTEKRFQQLDDKRSRTSTHQQSVSFKKRRIQRKEKRNNNISEQEIHEGKTYETNIDMGEGDVINIEEIPCPLIKPEKSGVIPAEIDTIIFDLETTGLDNECDIIQIAAKHHSKGDTFSTFVQPTRGFIPRKITNITGIEMHGSNMFYNFEEVPSMTAAEGLKSFHEWLRKYNKVVLVAHNAMFDARVLVCNCMKYNLNCVLEHIVGFVDTLKMAKVAFPDRVKQGYRQETLVKDILHRTYTAHNAVEDVCTLSELFKLFNEKVNYLDNVTHVDHIIFNIERLKNEKKNINTFQQLIQNKSLSKSQALTLAGRGYTARHLHVVFQRSGKQGLSTILKDKIAKVEKTCCALVEYFSTIHDN